MTCDYSIYCLRSKTSHCPICAFVLVDLEQLYTSTQSDSDT